MALAQGAEVQPAQAQAEPNSQHRCRQGRTLSRQAIPNSGRVCPAGATQAPGALAVGGADGPHLRGVPFVVPSMWRADAHHRVHHLHRRHPADAGAHRGGCRAAAHHTSTRAAAVGRVRCAGGRWWAMVSSLSPIGTRRPKWPRTSRSISATVGEGRQQRFGQRFGQRCGAGLRLALSQNVQTDKSQATGLPLASKQTQCEAWDVKTLCQTCSHAVGFPIRQAHKAAWASCKAACSNAGLKGGESATAMHVCAEPQRTARQWARPILASIHNRRLNNPYWTKSKHT